jgi:hypothetical protein
MWDTLQREWRVVKETLALTPAPPSEEQKEALKALGYVAPVRTPAKK